ncbi:MAG: hypothetical protein ABUL44_03190, partial [Flavobacterium sp.]
MNPKEQYHLPIFEALQSTFAKSISLDIQNNYLANFKEIKKWICLSDYSIGGKKNDVITFSFLPYVVDIEELSKIIKNIAPKEIKHTKEIDSKFINFLKDSFTLNISIVLENHNYLFGKDFDGVIEILRNTLKKLIEDVDGWNLARPYMKEQNEKIRKKAKRVLRLVEHKKKIEIIKNLFLITLMGGYFLSFIANETNAEKVTWFSDRDAINDIEDYFATDIFSISFYEYLIGEKCEFYSAPAASADIEWYGELIKIP